MGKIIKGTVLLDNLYLTKLLNLFTFNITLVLNHHYESIL